MKRFLKPRSPVKKNELAVAAYATGLVEAEIIAGRLRTANIPCYVHQESVGRVLGLSIGAMGMVRVLVPKDYEQEAIALLDEPTLDELPPQLDEPPVRFD